MYPLSFRRFLLLQCAWCIIASTAGGCESQPLTETQRSINTVTLAQRNIAAANADVGRTLSALNQYCQKPGRSTFQDFVTYSRAVQLHARDLQDISAVMSDQGNTFFQKWDREISAMTNKQLQSRAVAQRDLAHKAFQQIDDRGPTLRDSYEKFLSDLNNLQTFFDYDKSPDGITAAAPLIQQTQEHGGDLQHQLDLQAANVARVKDIFSAMESR